MDREKQEIVRALREDPAVIMPTDHLAKLRQLYRDYDRETDTYKGNVLRARIWDEGRRLVGR